jgi:hypothetical protein
LQNFARYIYGRASILLTILLLLRKPPDFFKTSRQLPFLCYNRPNLKTNQGKEQNLISVQGVNKNLPQRSKMEQIFVLPSNLSTYANGKYQGGNYQLIIDDNHLFVWLIQQMVPIKREFAFIARGIPGNSPFSCCANQWSVESGSPMISETKIYLRAIERGENIVRVSIEQHGFTSLDVAVGIILPKFSLHHT